MKFFRFFIVCRVRITLSFIFMREQCKLELLSKPLMATKVFCHSTNGTESQNVSREELFVSESMSRAVGLANTDVSPTPSLHIVSM